MNVPETEGERRTLLLVDDDDAFRNRLVRAMEKRGYDVSAAASVSEAQELAHRVKPEFAVVDLRMPDGSGLDVVKTLRQARENMRIVILTGYGNIATAVAAVKVGAVDYLAKPANADEIHRRSMPATGRCRRRRRTRCPPIASVGNISSVSSSNSTATSRKRRVA